MQPTTVSALKDSGFYLATKIENAAELIEMLHYVDFLAQLNAVDIGKLELPFEGNKFTLTKSEVTKLFFGHIEAKKEEIKAAVVPIPDRVLETIKSNLASTRVNMRERALRDVRVWSHEARDLYNSAEEKLANAVKRKKEIMSVAFDDPADAIRKVVAGLPSTNWDFLSYDSYEKRLHFSSRSDILLVHKVPEAGLSYEMNCGKFKCTIDLITMRTRIKPYSGCVTQEDMEDPDSDWNIHPNVNSDGVICWGNAVSTIEEAHLGGDILKTLQVLDALLPNYGQPAYVDIEQFQKDINKRDERLRNDRGQKEETPEAETTGDEEFVTEEDDGDYEFDGTEDGDNDDDL